MLPRAMKDSDNNDNHIHNDIDNDNDGNDNDDDNYLYYRQHCHFYYHHHYYHHVDDFGGGCYDAMNVGVIRHRASSPRGSVSNVLKCPPVPGTLGTLGFEYS